MNPEGLNKRPAPAGAPVPPAPAGASVPPVPASAPVPPVPASALAHLRRVKLMDSGVAVLPASAPGFLAGEYDSPEPPEDAEAGGAAGLTALLAQWMRRRGGKVAVASGAEADASGYVLPEGTLIWEHSDLWHWQFITAHLEPWGAGAAAGGAGAAGAAGVAAGGAGAAAGAAGSAAAGAAGPAGAVAGAAGAVAGAAGAVAGAAAGGAAAGDRYVAVCREGSVATPLLRWVVWLLFFGLLGGSIWWLRSGWCVAIGFALLLLTLWLVLRPSQRSVRRMLRFSSDLHL